MLLNPGSFSHFSGLRVRAEENQRQADSEASNNTQETVVFEKRWNVQHSIKVLFFFYNPSSVKYDVL